MTEEIHKVFNPFFKPQFTKIYTFLKTKFPDQTLLIMPDHPVHDDFFWELNSFLIETNSIFLPENIKNQPIIPLPYNSSNSEFVNLLSKIKHGTMLLDALTFFRLTFKKKDPFYFYCNRLVIHKTGEVSYYAGRKF